MTAAKIIKLALIVFLTTTSLTACVNMQDGAINGLVPKPLLLRNLPKGDDPFSMGFRHGCYNFMGQNGYGLSRLYDAPPDPELFNNPLYREAYSHGDRYCGVYVNRSIIL